MPIRAFAYGDFAMPRKTFLLLAVSADCCRLIRCATVTRQSITYTSRDFVSGLVWIFLIASDSDLLRDTGILGTGLINLSLFLTSSWSNFINFLACANTFLISRIISRLCLVSSPIAPMATAQMILLCRVAKGPRSESISSHRSSFILRKYRRRFVSNSCSTIAHPITATVVSLLPSRSSFIIWRNSSRLGDSALSLLKFGFFLPRFREVMLFSSNA